MDFDLSVVENCREDEAYFRLYRWKPYCISLGAGQNLDSIDINKTANDKIDIVKRPTGGRAILHAEEITYSVVFPLSKISSLRSFYFETNKALREGLIFYDERLSSAELESEQPNFRKFYREPSSEICFAVSAKSEVKYRGKKLVGSAQRKINNAVLQHGSLLCGDFHKGILKFLKLNYNDCHNLEEELSNKTIELESILDYKTDYEKLENSLLKGFEKYFSIKFEYIHKDMFTLTEY